MNGPRSSTEQGSLSAFVAVLALSLFILVGLVVDGGRAIAAHRQAIDIAEQAARAGAERLSLDNLRGSGSVTVDPGAALQGAETFLAEAGQQGDVSVSGQSVTVRIHVESPTSILGIVGITSIPVSASATATNVHGVTRED
jgi:Flp pilus assembly protein TadG